MTVDNERLDRPTPAEQARTTLAVARSGVLTTHLRHGSPVLRAVTVHSGGDPVELSFRTDDPAGAVLEPHRVATLEVLAAGCAPTTVYGQVRQLRRVHGRIIRCALDVQAVRLGMRAEEPVDLGAFRVAEADPLRGDIPQILDHLRRDHGPDLVNCLRAQGHGRVQWAEARRLDRFGLELTVLDGEGVATVRLDFPQPVTCLRDLSPGLYLALRGRCRDCDPEECDPDELS